LHHLLATITVFTVGVGRAALMSKIGSRIGFNGGGETRPGDRPVTG